jgi:hypothetical protein
VHGKREAPVAVQIPYAPLVALAGAVRQKLSHERFDSLSERLADVSRGHYPAQETNGLLCG